MKTPCDEHLDMRENNKHNKRARKSNEIRKKYNELLLAVSSKFPRETRHETILRYIREAESRAGDGVANERR